jgi:MFS family permease
MGVYTLGPFLGPTIGPLVGGFINQNTSWRWTFYLIIIWAGIQFVILCFTPETYGPAVLKKKAKYLRREENTDKYKAKIEVEEKSLVKAIGDFCTRPFGIPTLVIDLTVSVVDPRIDMSPPLYLHRFHPLNLVPLLRSIPPGIHEQSRLRITVRRPRLLRSWNRRTFWDTRVPTGQWCSREPAVSR